MASLCKGKETSLKNTFLFHESVKSSLLHDVHVSKSEINYDVASKTIQLTTHIFIDDLEKAIVKSGRPNPNIGLKSELANADEIVAEYVSSKFVINKYSADFLGKELSDDHIAVYCYFEIELKSDLRSITFDNNVLHDIYEDQKNIVSISKNKRLISQKIFDFDDTALTIEL